MKQHYKSCILAGVSANCRCVVLEGVSSSFYYLFLLEVPLNKCRINLHDKRNPIICYYINLTWYRLKCYSHLFLVKYLIHTDLYAHFNRNICYKIIPWQQYLIVLPCLSSPKSSFHSSLPFTQFVVKYRIYTRLMEKVCTHFIGMFGIQKIIIITLQSKKLELKYYIIWLVGND